MSDKGIESLDHNVQGEAEHLTYEGNARKSYRKWDNVKHIGDVVKTRFVPRKTFGHSTWGIKIRAVQRSDDWKPSHLRFGIVVTVKNMDGQNLIDTFIQQCSLKQWIVNEIDIQNRIDIYQAADVEIDFDEPET